MGEGETFGDLLRRFRARAGLNSSELAQAVGAARMSVRAWEQGSRVPRDRARLEDLAEVLKLTSAEAAQLASAARFHQRQPGAPPPPTEAAEETNGTSPPPPVPTLRYQLRAPIADFVGRAGELRQVRMMLQAAQNANGSAIICGVRGMGGVGKTELAYKVAHELRPTFPDAQIIIELRGASRTPLTAAQALQIIIRAFAPDARLPDDLADLQRLYCALLHDQHALILADDARDTAQVLPLIPPTGSALLITSRLRFTLPGMTTLDLEPFRESEAVAVLRRICPRLAPVEASALAHACGYLPLALRVGAGILHNDPALPIEHYLTSLADDRQRLAHLRDPDDEQLDVAAALALSYDRLDTATQAVFHQLGVFVADFTAELAQKVVVAGPAANVTDVLRLLLRRNLVMYDATRGRWHLHDLVRDLARTYLEARGEWAAVMRRYARAAVTIVQLTQEQYQATGDARLTALARFDTERPHIDAARYWATANAGTPEGDRLLLDDALATVYIGRLRYDPRHERIPQGERALAAARRLGDRHGEGYALKNLGIIYWSLGEPHQAIPYYEQALVLMREIGDRRGEGQVLNNLALVYSDMGELDRAILTYEKTLVFTREMGDRPGEGRTLSNLGVAYAALGEAPHALALYEEALTIARALGDRHIEGLTLHNLGLAYYYLGQAQLAITYYEQDLTITRELGDRRGEGLTLGRLGNAYTELGDIPSAIGACMAALTIAQATEDRRGEAYALSYLARAQALQKNIEQATSTFTQALTLFQEISDRLGKAEGQRLFGLALIQLGQRERALPLLRASLAYEQEIGHAKAAEQAALVSRLEAGADLPAALHIPIDQRVIGGLGKPTDDGQ